MLLVGGSAVAMLIPILKSPIPGKAVVVVLSAIEAGMNFFAGGRGVVKRHLRTSETLY